LGGSGSFGLELIIYWDEQITSGGSPIVAIYDYRGVGGGIAMSQTDAAQLLNQFAPSIEQITKKAPALKNMSKSELTDFLHGEVGLTASVLLISGNELFTDEYSYEKGFSTETIQAGKIKLSHSWSESCQVVGAGYDFLAKWYDIGYSRSLSRYECIYSSVDGFCLGLDGPRTSR